MSVARFATLAFIFLSIALPAGQADVHTRLRDYNLVELIRLHMWVNLTYTEPEASAARNEADEDHNLLVTSEERARYEERTKTGINARLVSPQARLDNQTPTRQEVVRVEIQGLEGAATGRSDPVDFDLFHHVDYPPPPDRPYHVFNRGTLPTDKGGVAFTCPPGFVLRRGLGIFDWTVSPDLRTVRGQSDGQTTVEVIFARPDFEPELPPTFDGPAPASAPGDEEGGRGGIPAVGPLAALAAAGLAAATLGGRRRGNR